MMARTPGAAAASLALLVALLAAGCGVEKSEAPPPSSTPVPVSSTDVAEDPDAVAERMRLLQARLPNRPSDTVAIDAIADDSLVRGSTSGLGADARIEIASSTEERAYERLCRGQVDAIEVTTLPSQEIVEACRSRGLVIADPLQLASDAIVLATKNASDVGGDCITVAQANALYRAGSNLTNWAQLGFDDLPIRPAGREEESATFDAFGRIVLNRATPTLADVRSDYIVRASDPRLRREVTNGSRREEALARVRRYRERVVERTLASRRRAVNAAEARADRRVLALVEKENERNRKLQITVDAAAVAERNRRRVERAKRRARDRANAAYDRRVDALVRRYRAEQLEEADRPGAVGTFRFSYYELFEEQLRPLEIDFGVPATSSGQPVRFGDLRPSDQRRLARAVLASSTQTEEGEARGAEAGTVSGIDPETPLGGIEDLPAVDAEGNRIYSGPGCVFPAQTTITTGVYPLTRRFFIITTDRALRRAAVVDVLDRLLQASRRIATESRLVPVTDQQLSDSLTAIRGERPDADEVVDNEQETLPPTTTAEDGSVEAEIEAEERESEKAESGSRSTTTAPTTPPREGEDSGIPGVSSRGD